MSIRNQIIDLLNANPNLDSNEIAEKLGIKLSAAKVTLCKMSSQGKLSREKLPVKVAKAGGKTQYRYKVVA
jgi:predicted transcriptional regulator